MVALVSELTMERKADHGLLRKFLVLGAVLVFGAATCTAIYYGILYHQLHERVQHQSKIPVSETNGTNFVKSQVTHNMASDKVRIITKDKWLAQPPTQPANPLKHPVPCVVILHTATKNCSTQAQCTLFVRQIQTYHIKSCGYLDIGHSFLVGGDGNVYEGRGWDGAGAFTYGYNNVSIGIGFIGTFISALPSEKQIAAGKALIAEGVRLGKISKDYKLLAHRQLSRTESPGLAFFENIKTWDHWAEKP